MYILTNELLIIYTNKNITTYNYIVIKICLHKVLFVSLS